MMRARGRVFSAAGRLAPWLEQAGLLRVQTWRAAIATPTARDPAHYAPDHSLLLDAGPHELVISAPGHITQTRMLTANGAERRSLSLILQPEAPRAVEAPPSVTTRSVLEPLASQRPQPLPLSAAPDAGFVATRSATQWVGLGIAAGGVVATVAFVVAGVLATAGATTYWLAPSEQATPSGAASLRASAAVSGRALTLGLTGRF
jgi:hypothetical protein